ncbi:MAG TPA: response regulator [Vicinamibacterales bacterium]|nr:response regulator [Vicinamibacterales bacterium]
MNGASVVKPKVLLVDDHPEVLRSLTRMLAPHVNVVAAVTDAREALDAAQRFDPDIAVLDITMPGRDGFQIAQDLEELGSRARVIFLTMHESEDFVAEAFRSGGRGYVLKTRLHLDLISALERIHAGQRFLPSIKSLLALERPTTSHVIQFHLDDHALVESVGSLLHAALRRGDAVSAVFNESIRVGLSRRLQAYGWNVGDSGVYGRYRAADPADSLAFVMRDGRAEPERIQQLIAQLDSWRQSVSEDAGSRLTIAGAISAQLLLDGDVTNALEVESRWDAFTRDLPFVTVCCYSMEGFASQAQADALPHLCGQHFALAHAQ